MVRKGRGKRAILRLREFTARIGESPSVASSAELVRPQDQLFERCDCFVSWAEKCLAWV